MKKDVGYYRVGNEIFGNKFDAVLRAQELDSDVKWNFFDDILTKVNWYNEPNQTLDELYRIRAQQIRNSYDYIIVFCSGGSDSNNVIRTFLKNNIHVDEVMALAPMSGLKNWNFDPNNLSEDNTISETEFALFPLLHEISNSNPKIKITVNDFFENMIQYKDEQWAFQACGNIVTALTSHFTDVLKFKHISNMLEQGKRVGLVYGTDKPIIRIMEDNSLCFVLADSGINYLNMPAERERPNLDRVLFYWSAELPELMVKQAHVVGKIIQLPQYKYLQDYLRARPTNVSIGTFQDTINQQIKHGLDPIDKQDIIQKYLTFNKDIDRSIEFSSKSVYQRNIVPFIYPTTYTKNLFQCQKVEADAGFFTTDQIWVHHLHKDSRISEMALAGTKYLYNAISPKYLNSSGTGFINKFKIYKFSSIV